MSVIIFLAVLFLLVLVHEWGHFIVAKLTGMRVDEFGIGFPPKLFGIKRGETEYTFNAMPIGGFVKIYGEDGSPEAPTVDRDRSFSAKSKWAQAAVLLAGVTMNVLFAWFLFSTAFAIGVQSPVNEATATESAKLIITSVLPGGPAAEALIPPNAVIHGVTAGGETLDTLTPSAFTAFLDAHKDMSVTVAYEHNGGLLVTEITPRGGVIADAPDRAAIGVALALIDTVAKPIPLAIKEGFFHTITMTRDIAVGVVKLLGDAVQFKADFTQVAGPVAIVGLVGEASAFGITSLIMFTAIISLNLAVVNVLPFPALDGGRLLFVIIEAIKGSPIPMRYASSLNMVGFALLILLMVLVTWNDIARLI
jgi:regulator of sigma E protease